MKIVFLGAGNVAHHLARECENAGHEILAVYSRKKIHADELAELLSGAVPTDQLDFSESEGQLFFLTLSDDAIDEVVARLVLPEEVLLVHTSGAKPLDDLRKLLTIYSDVPVKAGVLYPLQSISRKIELVWKEVPLCIEAEDEEAESQLIDLARQISEEVYLVNSEERLRLHMAAVFANNFPNHLWAIAKELLEQQNLEFDLLKPIIKETLRKALEADHPADVQTGPARRGDQGTMSRHLSLLEDEPHLARIYQILSESIMRWYL